MNKLIGVVSANSSSNKMLQNLQFRLQATAGRFGGAQQGTFAANKLSLFA